MEQPTSLTLIEEVSEWIEENRPNTPYAYKTRMNLVGKEIVEFMLNANGAVRYFVAPVEADELMVRTFIKQIERETR